ncbi:hypothetical protein L0Y65_03300 [Candidatus Micrarchaeota archaeon]|nr:hypothetical protein [Candidatus Micrarchaeota archaeon]
MDLEAELLKSMTKEELELRAAEIIESFHGFLTREVALRLIAKEKGLLKTEEKAYRLAEIPKGEKRIAFKAHVKKVWPVATYSSGKKSRVVEVQDETAAKPLVLWNQDVDLAAKLRTRDSVSVHGAYEKMGELHMGYSGTLEVADKAAFSDLAELDGLAEGEPVHIRGIVSRVEGYDGFVRGTRTVQGYSFFVSDGKSERRCVLFEGMGRSARIRPEDEIIIENARVGNGNVEIGDDSRIMTRRSREMLIGELTRMECVGEKLSVRVGEKEATLARDSAMRFLGVQAADDIDLCTLVSLKKDSLLNTRIAVRIEEKDGNAAVR